MYNDTVKVLIKVCEKLCRWTECNRENPMLLSFFRGLFKATKAIRPHQNRFFKLRSNPAKSFSIGQALAAPAATSEDLVSQEGLLV